MIAIFAAAFGQKTVEDCESLCASTFLGVGAGIGPEAKFCGPWNVRGPVAVEVVLHTLALVRCVRVTAAARIMERRACECVV